MYLDLGYDYVHHYTQLASVSETFSLSMTGTFFEQVHLGDLSFLRFVFYRSIVVIFFCPLSNEP